MRTVCADVSACEEYKAIFIRAMVSNEPATELLDGSEVVIDGLLRFLFLSSLLQVRKASLDLAR